MGLFDLFKRRKPGQQAEEAEHGEQAVASPEAVEEPAPSSAETAPEQPAAEAPPAPARSASPAQAQPASAAVPAARGRLRTALNRTRAFLASTFTFDASANVSDEYYDSILDGLLLADVGSELSAKIVSALRKELSSRGLVRQSDAAPVLREILLWLLSEVRQPEALDPGKLAVIMLVGVNGSGKTTLTAKLGARLKAEGRTVLLCAADTFRAAAVDQLKVWAQRTGVDIVAGQEGADPASVVFDACQAAQARGVDVLLVDTAGRLQTKSNLMAELEKVARTVDKAAAGANIAHILVLDSTVGQNALSQAELFNECCRLSGLALTKMDGTAKGGAVLNVVSRLKVPVLYVGVGEGVDDILDFDATEFVEGLLPEG